MEITLEQLINQLPDGHVARMQYYALTDALLGLEDIMSECDAARGLKERGDWYVYLACGLGDKAANVLNETMEKLR